MSQFEANFVARISEVYFSSEDNIPVVVLTGALSGGEVPQRVEGPLEITIRGRGIETDGLVIGRPVWISMEEPPVGGA